MLNLCRIGEVDLLWQMYGRVSAPHSVQQEFVRAVQAYDRFQGLQFPGFIAIHQPQKTLQAWLPAAVLDQGESDAIALTLELHADLLLIDERKGRRAAANLGIRFAGILGVLVQAKQQALIPQLKNMLVRLRQEAGF
ncbi:DUF3368 domain-containing protein [Prosthecobacter sp.]